LEDTNQFRHTNNTIGGVTMAKFRVYGKVVATKYIGEFEADSEGEVFRRP
jgi:hypothetical protein